MENRFPPAISEAPAASGDAASGDAASPQHDENSPGENSFADILSQFEQQHGRSNNEALEGTVVSISPESVFVNIGR